MIGKSFQHFLYPNTFGAQEHACTGCWTKRYKTHTLVSMLSNIKYTATYMHDRVSLGVLCDTLYVDVQRCFANTILHEHCTHFALVAIQGSKWRRQAIQVQRDPILSSSSKLLNSNQCQDPLLVNAALLLLVPSVAKHCNGKNSHPLSSKSVSGPLTFEWTWIISSTA